MADNFAIFPSGTDHHSTAPDFRALYPKQAFDLYQTEARHGPVDGDATTVPRASNKHSVARLTADAPCHPGRNLPLIAPVQQEVARESRCPLSYIKKAGMKGQGEVRKKGQSEVRHAWACRDMPQQRALQTHPRDGPATKPTNQEPTRSPRCPIRS